jgi:hypothetical protein
MSSETGAVPPTEGEVVEGVEEVEGRRDTAGMLCSMIEEVGFGTGRKVRRGGYGLLCVAELFAPTIFGVCHSFFVFLFSHK